MPRRYIILFGLALIVVVLDQATKAWIAFSLFLDDAIEVIPGFFNLVYVLNRGAAFSFLNSENISWQRYLFIIASLTATGIILWINWGLSNEQCLLPAGLGLVLGGAAGNLVDRVRVGQVIDFLDFYVDSYHWPAFNVADSAITVGAGVVLISLVRSCRKEDTA